MNKDFTKLSKLLSLVLRHKPEEIGIKLDENGWTNINILLSQLKKHGHHITMDMLIKIVETNDKKRFALDDIVTKIRASQGHSVAVDLKLVPSTPPINLYHGTANKNVGSIFKNGLLKGKRHHVHLSDNKKTALKVGRRHGEPALFEIDTKKMIDAGYTFYRSDNGVWLTEFVPANFIYLKSPYFW